MPKDYDFLKLVQEINKDIDGVEELISKFKKCNLAIYNSCDDISRIPIDFHTYLEDSVYCIIINNRKRTDISEYLQHMIKRMRYNVEGIIYYTNKILFTNMNAENTISESNKLSKQLKEEIDEYLKSCNNLLPNTSKSRVIERGLQKVVRNPDQMIFQLETYIDMMSKNVIVSIQILNELWINHSKVKASSMKLSKILSKAMEGTNG